MKGIAWLIWVARYGNVKTHDKNLKYFAAFELYYLWVKLRGQKLTHWLEESSLPAGKYIVTKAIPYVGFNLFGRAYCFIEETPVEYVPYTPELARELSEKAGKPMRTEEISYVFGSRSER